MLSGVRRADLSALAAECPIVRTGGDNARRSYVRATERKLARADGRDEPEATPRSTQALTGRYEEVRQAIAVAVSARWGIETIRDLTDITLAVIIAVFLIRIVVHRAVVVAVDEPIPIRIFH